MMLTDLIIGRAAMGTERQTYDAHRHATLWCWMRGAVGRMARLVGGNR